MPNHSFLDCLIAIVGNDPLDSFGHEKTRAWLWTIVVFVQLSVILFPF